MCDTCVYRSTCSHLVVVGDDIDNIAFRGNTDVTYFSNDPAAHTVAPAILADGSPECADFTDQNICGYCGGKTCDGLNTSC